MVLTNQKAREKGANMFIVGCDYHPAFQQIAFVDTDTGECKSGDWSIARRRKNSTANWRPRNESARGDGSQWARALV